MLTLRQFLGFEREGLPDPGERRIGDADERSRREPPSDGSPDLFDAHDGAVRDCARVLPLTGEVHHDHGAVPCGLWIDPDVSRPAIREVHGEHNVRVASPALE